MFESKGQAVATEEGAEHGSADDTAHDSGHQRFTDHGPKPPVAPMREEPAGASASDLAFGPHGRINTSPGVNVRTSPEKADNIVGGLANGAAVVVEAREGEWMKSSMATRARSCSARSWS